MQGCAKGFRGFGAHGIRFRGVVVKGLKVCGLGPRYVRREQAQFRLHLALGFGVWPRSPQTCMHLCKERSRLDQTFTRETSFRAA